MTVATVRRVRSLLLVLAALLVTLAPAPAALAAPVAKPGAEVVSVTQVTDRQVDGCAVGGARRPDRARPAAHARRRWDLEDRGRHLADAVAAAAASAAAATTPRGRAAPTSPASRARATSSWSCRRRAGTLVQRPVEQRRGAATRLWETFHTPGVAPPPGESDWGAGQPPSWPDRPWATGRAPVRGPAPGHVPGDRRVLRPAPALNDEPVNRIKGFFAGRATTRGAPGRPRRAARHLAAHDPYHLAKRLAAARTSLVRRRHHRRRAPGASPAPSKRTSTGRTRRSPPS